MVPSKPSDSTGACVLAEILARTARAARLQLALALRGELKVVLEEGDSAGTGCLRGEVLRLVDVAAALMRAHTLRIELAPVLVLGGVVRGGGGAAGAADVVVDVGGGIRAPAYEGLVAGHLRREPPLAVPADRHPAPRATVSTINVHAMHEGHALQACGEMEEGVSALHAAPRLLSCFVLSIASSVKLELMLQADRPE